MVSVFFMDRRLYSYVGMAAPIVFTVSVMVLGAVTPGYSHVYHTISELGEVGAPYAGTASTVFIVCGLMIALFGYGLQQGIPRPDARVLSGLCVMVYGLFDFVGSGVFPVDAGGAADTVTASYHVTLTVLGELAALATPFMFLQDTENVLRWSRFKEFGKWIFRLSILASGFLVYAIGENSPGVIDAPIGLAQRILVGLFLAWIFVAAWNLRKNS
jgi:hypothetical membrane protein